MSEFKVGDLVQWVKPIKDGWYSIQRNSTNPWPEVGDVDEVVHVGTDGDLRLEGFKAIDSESCWFVRTTSGHLRKIGVL